MFLNPKLTIITTKKQIWLGWDGLALLGCTGLAGPFWAGQGLLGWLGWLGWRALGWQTTPNGASPRTLGRSIIASIHLESIRNPPEIHPAPTRHRVGLAGPAVEGLAGLVGWMKNTIWELSAITIGLGFLLLGWASYWLCCNH